MVVVEITRGGGETETISVKPTSLRARGDVGPVEEATETEAKEVAAAGPSSAAPEQQAAPAEEAAEATQSAPSDAEAQRDGDATATAAAEGEAAGQVAAAPAGLGLPLKVPQGVWAYP